MFKTIVVGTDGSETATKATRQAIDLAKTFDARLHFVSVYRPAALRHGGSEFDKSIDTGEVADSLLAEAESRARVAGVASETHSVTGSPAEAICDVAEAVGADLVVVGNKGMTGARRVLGSVPNSVAHKAHCSVMILATT